MPKGTPGPAAVKARKEAIRKLSDEGFVSIDAAVKLGVSRGRLYKMAALSMMGAKKVGKSIFVKRAQVEAAARSMDKPKGRPRNPAGSLLRNKQPARAAARRSSGR